MKKTILIVLLSLTLSLLASCSSQSSKQIMPYNLKWGDSYEELSKKAGDITELEENEAGKLLSGGTIDNSYLGLSNDSLKMSGNYSFDSDKKLDSILIIAYLKKNDELDDEAFFDGLIDHYTDIIGSKPEDDIMGYTWTTDTTIVNAAYMSEGTFLISLEQVE